MGQLGAVLLVDDDPPTLVELQANVLQAKSGGVWPATNGDEDDVGIKLHCACALWSATTRLQRGGANKSSGSPRVFLGEGVEGAPTDSALPPLAASTFSLMVSPDLSPSTTLVESLKSMPCFLRIFWVCLAISESMPGPPIWFRNSTTVTLEPRRDQTEAISRPIMPPPMTMSFSGTFSRAMAPVLLTTRFSSISRPGKGVASEPVAIRMFLPTTLVSPPSLSWTLTSCSLTKEPEPLRYSTPFFLKRNSTPFVRPATEVSLAFISWARFSLTSLTSIPLFLVSWRIWW